MIFEASVPSNIALLKYWGKSPNGLQIAANPSLSMTLSHCRTTTQVQKAQQDRLWFEDNEISRESSFGTKVFAHLAYLKQILQSSDHFEIRSSNTFPNSCGIASSASGLGALTLGVLAAHYQADHWQKLESVGFCRARIADLARMGSGSAGRSFWGGFVEWDQDFVPKFEQDHWQLSDTIVVIDNQAKSSSSSQGHKTAWTSPLFTTRLAGIKRRQTSMLNSLKTLNMTQLGIELEAEALEMHSVMLSSQPPQQYWHKATGELIAWLRKLREKTQIPAYFTLDAGPNPHILSPIQYQEELVAHLQRDFPETKLILDQVGSGPTIQRRNKLGTQ